ncbi:hypothetical protein I7X12_16595 [Halosimplex litoreum]|uniref:Uncharacterized protein n=1 Tax=Halosimplex litoreum TaxID=1198301 RepID=A0A7T3KV07_9EURY|nr:hypothetical protein [Halosimplex litoreum]QPV62340.1 hypothetical protein I7X12_16595 [Halosimplex litoreum]
MPPEISGYDCGGSIQVEELCGLFHDSDSQLNDFFDDLGIETSFKEVSCASVGISSGAAAATGVLSGWQGFALFSTVCGGTTMGCIINDAIRNNTPCGSQIIDVYIPESIDDGAEYPPVLLLIRCEKDVSDDIEQLTEDITDRLDNAADEAVDITIKTGTEIADQLKDAAGSLNQLTDDIIDAGQDIIF